LTAMSIISRAKGQVHHYSPRFYLKRWAGSDGRLCEYSRPRDIVKPRMTHPSGTGYVRDLYTIAGLPPERSQVLENPFMKVLDQKASDTLDKLLDGRRLSRLDVSQKSAWARFIMSLIQRHPEKIAWIARIVGELFDYTQAALEADYEKFRKSGDPPTFTEYKASLDPNAREILKAVFLRDIADLPNVGRRINGMLWSVVTLSELRPSFLTSDRPVVMTNGLAFEMAHIIIPISPRALFLAANNPRKLNQLQNALMDGALTDHVNHTVAAQAQKFVYFVDGSLLSFVEDRLGRYPAQFIVSDLTSDMARTSESQG
jgi:hypothetical protein